MTLVGSSPAVAKQQAEDQYIRDLVAQPSPARRRAPQRFDLGIRLPKQDLLTNSIHNPVITPVGLAGRRPFHYRHVRDNPAHLLPNTSKPDGALSHHCARRF
jgi:hypothetical protein